MGDAQSCLACDSKRASTTREVRKAVPTHRYNFVLHGLCNQTRASGCSRGPPAMRARRPSAFCTAVIGADFARSVLRA